MADPDARRGLGVTDESRVEDLVRYVEDNGLAEALDPTRSSREDPRSRRWLRHRRQMADAARIEPVNLTTGQAPTRRQLSPSLRQLGSIDRWAAKVRSVENGPPAGD